MHAEKNNLGMDNYGIGTKPVGVRTGRIIPTETMASKICRKRTPEAGLFKAMMPILEKISAPRHMMDGSFMFGRKVIASGIAKNRMTVAVAAACILAVSRTYRKVISEKEMAAIANIEKKNIGRVYRIIQKEFGIPAADLSHRTRAIISKSCAMLGISMHLQRESLELFSVLNHREMTHGRNPYVVAGAVIYMAAKKHGNGVTFKKMSSVCDVTANGIINAYEKFACCDVTSGGAAGGRKKMRPAGTGRHE